MTRTMALRQAARQKRLKDIARDRREREIRREVYMMAFGVKAGKAR